MKTVSHQDSSLVWSGVISVETTDDWTMPWRLPYQNLDLYPFETLHAKASLPSGVRLRFATDSSTIVYHFASPEVLDEGDLRNFDLYVDGNLLETKPFTLDDRSVTFENLPSGIKTIELWLHQFTPFKLQKIEIDDNASIERSEDTRPKWITYGSSITHCRGAGSPSFTWPGVVARAKGLNLTSLGFGGECHADPMIARLIRDSEADFISLKLGINILGGCSLAPRSFRPAVIGYIATIREKHPETPLVVCSPIYCPPRETEMNQVALCLQDMRKEVEAAVETFSKRGDKNIYYLDGLKLINEELVEFLPDELHPNAEGYKRLGENFYKAVFEELALEIPKK